MGLVAGVYRGVGGVKKHVFLDLYFMTIDFVPKAGLGIVCESKHFHGSETDSVERERKRKKRKKSPQGKEIGGTIFTNYNSIKKRKKEAPVLVPYRIPTKHSECVHMWLSPVLVM